MPVVQISVTKGELSEKQKVKMANEITDLIIKAIPGLEKIYINVIFYDNPPENWVVGGLTVKEIMQKSKQKVK